MKKDFRFKPDRVIFWGLIYSIAAPIIGFALIALNIQDVFIWLPRIFYSFTFLPVFLISIQSPSLLMIIGLSVLPIISFGLAGVNCFFSIKKKKTLFIIPTMVCLVVDLLMTSLVMLSGQSLGAIFSFICDIAYLVMLFYLREEIKGKSAAD